MSENKHDRTAELEQLRQQVADLEKERDAALNEARDFESDVDTVTQHNVELQLEIITLKSALKVARDELYGKTELLKSIHDVLEEAQTYCEGPQWSPSMAEECKEALAKINEVLK